MNFYKMMDFLHENAPDLEEDQIYDLLYAFEDNEDELQAILGGDVFEHEYPGLGGTGTSKT